MHAAAAWALALGHAPGGAVSDAEGLLWSGLANSRSRPGAAGRNCLLPGSSASLSAEPVPDSLATCFQNGSQPI